MKLQWLQSSVKNEALALIQHLSLSSDNYIVAKERLDKRFNNEESIKHMLFQSLLNFKCEPNPKYTKTLASVTGLNNALEELKTVHGVDLGEKFQEEILREILFYNLPVPIRQVLINKLNKNYPSSKEILDNVEDAVIQLNLLESYNSPKNGSREPKVTTSDAKAKDVTTFNVNHKKNY